MSFLTVVEQDLAAVDAAALSAAKTTVAYVENVVVTDLIPELESALLTALGAFSQTEIAAAVSSLKAAV